MIKKITAVLLAMLGFSVLAATDSEFTNSKGAVIKYNSKGDIVRGEWTCQFTKAYNQAQAEGVPLVIFWANNGCGHCAAVEVEMATSGFKKWMKEQKLYMVFTCGGYPGPCGYTINEAAAKPYAKDPSGQFPYIGVYWNNGGSKIAKRGTFTGNGMNATRLESSIMNLLRGYKPSVGGYFADTEQGESRYEVEPTTKQVELILARDESNKAAGDDEVKFNGKTYRVTWAKNAKTASVIVDVPTGAAVGGSYTAVVNGESKAKYKCTIHCVAAKPNSAGNPDWKDAEIEYGRWTANVEGAKEFVKAKGGCTLVSVQGSLWCPDCANTERNFLDLEKDGANRFRAWAAENKVALAVVDIPNYSKDDPNGTASPSLLSRVAVAKTLGGTDPVVRSGLSYMTRKGISSAAAEEQAKLFKTLVQKNTDEGGFHRPEDANQFRTGVPIFVLLRRDGTVAARLTRLATVSPKAEDAAKFDNYLKRFDEMLAIAGGDPTEIENNYPSADSIRLPVDGTQAEGEISNADFQDSFALAGFNGAAVVEATVSGPSAASVTAQFMQEQDGEVVNVGEPVTGKISGGFKVRCDFQRAGACYLLVKGADITAKEFAVESSGSTVQKFEVSARVASLNPQQAKATVPVKAGEEISLNVTSGKVYRVVGATPVTGYFEAEGRDGLFTALVDGDAKVRAERAGTLEYQEWVPAEIGFSVTSETRGESDGTVRVKVLRNGGVSGRVKATVALNKDETTFYYDHDDKTKPRFWINGQTSAPYFESTELVWEDGDDDDREITIKLEQDAELARYYGDGKVALAVTGVTSDKGDATVGKSDYVLNVKDESKSTKCRVSVVRDDPYWNASVYVRKKDGLDVELARSDVGAVEKNYIIVKPSTSKAVLTAGAGNELFRSGNKQYWMAEDYTNKLVHVDLAKMSDGSSATITLTEKKDSKKKVVSYAADSASRQVKVCAVANDAPSFVTNKVGTFKYVTHTYCYESVAFDTAFVKNAGKLSVKLVKGSLPKGVTASVSGGKLWFKGFPTTAGSYTAYYQAQEKRGTKTVKGLVVKVTFRIVDPTTVKPTDATYGQLANAAVKSTRTFKTLPVLAKVDDFYRVVGTLNVTLPKTGKVSAKFTGREDTVSFSAKCWDRKSFDLMDGTLSCTMTKSGYTLTVEAHPDSTVVATVSNEEVLEQEAGAITAGKVWSSKSSAKAWKGIYNAALVPGGKRLYLGSGDPTNLVGGVTQPTATNEFGEAAFLAPAGYGYVNFKMTTKAAYEAGKMTWAGRLPNGQKISGTAYLTKGDGEVVGRSGYAYLPVFQRLTESDKKSGDLVALVAEIQDNAEKEGGLRYVQGSPDLYPETDALFDLDGAGEKAPSDFPLGDWEHAGVPGTGTDYGMDLHLLGSYYDPAKDLRACCKEQSVPTEQLLQLEAPAWVGSTSKRERCEAEGIAELNYLTVKKNEVKVAGDATTVPVKFSVSLNRDTGVLSGKVRVYAARGADGSRPKLASGLTYVEATWTGVMTTGWGAQCGCTDDDALTLPFICGALSFTDEVPYRKLNGTVTAVKQLTGGEVYSGARAR